MKKEFPREKLNKHRFFLNSERSWENRILTVVVVRNFTYPIYVIEKGRHLDELSIYTVYSYENAFDFLLNKFNQKLFKE